MPLVSSHHLVLQGPIPSAWAASPQWAQSLKSLEVSGSELSSSVPSEWGLQALTYLDLSNNSLTGSFEGLATSSLWYLDISNNYLTGSVGAIASVSNMTIVRLSNNTGIAGQLTAGALQCR